jgi:hypothetical protein
MVIQSHLLSLSLENANAKQSAYEKAIKTQPVW